MSGTRQRRGKKQSAGQAQDSTASATGENDSNSASVDEQLKRAMTTVIANKFASEQLHAQWRRHLLFIGFLMMMMALYQTLEPMRECIMEIKAVNSATSDGYGSPIDGKEAVLLVFQESICDIVHVALTSLLAYFLALEPHGDFSSWQYVASCTLVPMQLSLFYQTKRTQCTGGIDLMDVEIKDRTRRFPIGIIFHVIVTGAYWFMKVGMDKCMANVKVVEGLKNQLEGAKEASKKRNTKK